MFSEEDSAGEMPFFLTHKKKMNTFYSWITNAIQPKKDDEEINGETFQETAKGYKSFI